LSSEDHPTATAPERCVLADHVAGPERHDSTARFDAFFPVYQALAQAIG